MTNGPAFLDSPHAPDIYADAASGTYVVNGNMKITFESWRVDHSSSPGPIRRVVVGRVVLPVAQAEKLARGLLDRIERDKAQSKNKTSTIQ
jgi:hypothetical protein